MRWEDLDDEYESIENPTQSLKARSPPNPVAHFPELSSGGRVRWPLADL